MDLSDQRSVVPGACPLDCPDTCGVYTTVENSRAVEFLGDPDHPITQGWLCAKVRPYLDHVYHPDRLRYPMKRSGAKGSGRWQRVSWEEAITEICNRWREIIASYGSEAILPYSFSGTLGLLQLVVCNARFWNRLGASQLQRSICDAAAGMAIKATLGARIGPPYQDVLNSKLVILWAHNPVSTAPHFMPFLRKAQRSGTELIVIDPQQTRTTKGADWHVMPLPGTDGALALGLAHVILDEGLEDEDWLHQHTLGWSAYKERINAYPPQRVASITGLPIDSIRRLAVRYATLKPGIIKFGDGLNRNLNGGQAVRALLSLPAVTGQYGKLGGGVAYSTSDLFNWDEEAVNKWSECPRPGRSINMNRLGAGLLGEVEDPPMKSLYVFAANPVASTANASKVVEGLKREGLFTVVHELYMTDTADYADIVLPATSQLEQIDLHRGYGHSYMTYNQRAIAPLAECKSNWDVMRLLAAGMNIEEPWLKQSADEVIGEILEASSAHQPALEGITLEKLRDHVTLSVGVTPGPPFNDGRFPTPSGKLELYSEWLADQGIDPLPGHNPHAIDNEGSDYELMQRGPVGPLLLVSGAAHHFVSSSMANQDHHQRREGQPVLKLHPQDAAERNIDDGDLVLIENGRGDVTMSALVTESVRPGVVASPKGYWPKLTGGKNLNWLTSDTLADLAGQSTYHSSLVWVSPAH